MGWVGIEDGPCTVAMWECGLGELLPVSQVMYCFHQFGPQL